METLRFGLVVLFVVLSVAIADTETNTITTLPGYDGPIPFKLETGYVGVGSNSDVQLFYYFVESGGTPSEDPLLVWITGGPGCSSLHALTFQSGPVTFKYGECSRNLLPALFDNPYTWTKNLSIIYLDAPVGAGYSYSKTYDGYYSSDYEFVDHVYEFTQTWLRDVHPEFRKSELYFGGDGYSGKQLPMLLETILNATDAETKLNLKGYILGNPGTNDFIDFNSQTRFGHRIGFIPDALFKDADGNCSGNFWQPDQGNAQCVSLVGQINTLLSGINRASVLDARCRDVTMEPACKSDVSARRSLEQGDITLQAEDDTPTKWCRGLFDMYHDTWANDLTVQEALHVRPGSISSWKYCNDSIIEDGYSYYKNITDAVGTHQRLTKSNLNGLIFSGDHDMEVSYIATLQWIDKLGLTLSDQWRPWIVANETAGYTQGFVNDDFSLTFATVKGAGHFAPDYKPKECQAMVDRWLTDNPL